MSQYAPESVKSRDHVKGFHNQTDAILGIDPATNQLRTASDPFHVIAL